MNKLPIDESPNRWIRIKHFVVCINITKETILKGRKTKLCDWFDLDEIIQNPDFEEELVLSDKMAKVMLEEETTEKDLDDKIEVNADKGEKKPN